MLAPRPRKDPSPGTRQLVKVPAAVHPLLTGERWSSKAGLAGRGQLLVKPLSSDTVEMRGSARA